MFIANSKKQDLTEHSQAIAKVALQVYEELGLELNEITTQKLKVGIKIAALFHDIGKITLECQSYLNDEPEYNPDIGETASYSDDNPLHNEVSELFLLAFWPHLRRTLSGDISQDLKQQIIHSIYWHHAEPKRTETCLDILNNYITNKCDIDDLIIRVNDFCSSLKLKELHGVTITKDDLLDALEKFKQPDFFKLNINIQPSKDDWIAGVQADFDTNAQNFIARFCLIFADRYVSSLEASDLKTATYNHPQFNDTHLLKAIEQYIKDPSLDKTRTNQQKEAAKKLISSDLNVAVGPAGSGKTRLAVICNKEAKDSLKSGSGILWIVPRVAVGEAILEELMASIPEISISLVTGEQKKCWQNNAEIEVDDLYSADIIVTTIDQVVKWLVSNSAHSEFFIFMKRYVVWDEYHEIFAIQALYYVSAFLMRIKEYQKYNHLFISATPDPLNLQLIGKNNISWRCPVILESFNTDPFDIQFQPLADVNQAATVYIFNSAAQAQRYASKSWLNGREDIDCYHSKFQPRDKHKLTKSILDKYGINPADKSATLFSGPISQAALGISREFLITELNSPAGIIHRIGRNNRFAEYGKGNVTILTTNNLLSEKNKTVKQTGYRSSLNSNAYYYQQYSYQFFIDLIQHFTISTSPITNISNQHVKIHLNELNKFYLDFHVTQSETESVLIKETKIFINDARKYLKDNKLFIPQKQTTISKTKVAKVRVSYRGISLWATMHHLNIDNVKYTFKDLIGLPSHPEDLVSLSATEYYLNNIDLPGNLHEMTHASFKPLQTSIKFRARGMGCSETRALLIYSRNSDHPLVCSSTKSTDKTGLYYLSATNDNGNTINLGYYIVDSLSKALSTLKPNTDKDDK